MRNNPLVMLATFLLLLSTGSCLKDTAYRTYTYTMYKPVYKTADEVRANVKNTAPQSIVASGKIWVSGHYIFLAENGKGVHVINNTDPSHPVNESYINIPGCTDIAANGNILYADCYTDMLTIDISNPKAVQLKNYINNIFPDRQYVLGYQIDSGKVVADWIIKDTTVTDKMEMGRFYGNIFYSDRSQTFSSGTLSSISSVGSKSTGGSMARFAINSGHLYTVTNSSLNVVDINTPALPQWKKTMGLGWNIETIYPFKDKLFIGASNGMHIVSISNPGNPQLAGIFTHATVCDPVIAEEKYAYVTLRSGTTCNGFTNQMDVVDVSNIASPVLKKSYPFTNPKGLSKDGNWLFVCDGTTGVKMLNAADPLNISLQKNIELAESYDVICIDGIAIITAKDGLYQYSYSNSNDVRLLSKIGISK